MTKSKETIIESINEAKANLEKALEDMEHLPLFDGRNIGFAAHALNNYLTVIGGGVRLLQMTLKDYPGKDVHMWLDGLNHAGKLMMHTVNQLMGTASKDKPHLLFSKVDFAILVNRLCDYYQTIATKKEIRIIFKSALPELPYVWADRIAVAAVIDNLLSNAVKYSEHGKQITVEVKVNSSHAICVVKDQGPGLNVEDQAKLFQKGVRLGSVTTGGEPSTGYGLAVAKELIGQLGGEIWCESEIGKGSSFSFKLPLYNENEHDN